ncbi:acyltransferase [Chitinophaga sancti]|uniref:acyltransferase n=1 Tax=Chitinophaga sancti TaxID=1004 RepID=UPI002A7641A6|nr:acyltransferase [Chitinophaga sancti]WPQ65731.1 acyltransferase [Chitinophaga sancti]
MNDRQHITGFDFIRPIAALSVVWIHGCAGSILTKRLNPLNAYAVPVFIAISMFLFAWQIIGKGRRNFREMLVTRIQRLMIPFFLWTLIYLGIRIFKARFIHEPFEMKWIETFVFKGSSYQLWYLPNLFYLSLLFFPLLNVAVRNRKIANVVIFFIVCISAIVLWYTPSDIKQADWFTRHILLYFVPSLISASIGMLFYINYEKVKEMYGTSLYILVPIWAVALFFAQLFMPHVLTGLAFVAVLFPLLLFQVNGSYPGMMALSRNSMGIYLIHGVFLEGIKTGMQLIHHPVQGLVLTLGSIIVTYLLSFGVSEILSKNDILRKYLMGN